MVRSWEKRDVVEMNTVSAVQKMLGRTASSKKMVPSARNSGGYGVSDHVCMEELPHPARNLTVSRVVIMVFTFLFSSLWRGWELCMLRLGYKLLLMATTCLSGLCLRKGCRRKELLGFVVYMCSRIGDGKGPAMNDGRRHCNCEVDFAVVVVVPHDCVIIKCFRICWFCMLGELRVMAPAELITAIHCIDLC